MNGADRRLELSDFLRTRRAKIAPSDVGLADGPRRRTPGLRREEVCAAGQHRHHLVHAPRTGAAD